MLIRANRYLARARSIAFVIAVVAVGCKPAGSSTEGTAAEAPSASAASVGEGALSADPFSSPDSARVRARVDSVFARFDRPGSPGCIVTVMQAGDIVFARGYGSADIQRGTAFTTASAFDAASMVKQFLAFGIVLLASEGKLSLNDPVQKHLPELPGYGATVTLRHLVHHTSGLRDWEASWLSGRENVDPAMLSGLSFPPGEDHVYDDTGYALLQRIVERVSGRSWNEFAGERIFGPLGMVSSGSQTVRRIQAYRPVPGGGYRVSMTPPGEGFTTTPEDLARWDRNFYEPRVGNPELNRMVLSEGQLNNGETIPYAFGLHTEPYHGLRRVWHGGLNQGYRSQWMRFPDERMSVLTVCNVFGIAEPNGLTERVVDIVLEDAIHRAEKATMSHREAPVEPPPASDLTRFAGLYLNRAEQAFRVVRLRDGRLEARHWITWHPLRPLGPGRFQVEGLPVTVAFEARCTGDGIWLSESSIGRRAPVVYGEVATTPRSAAELLQYTGMFRSGELGTTWRIAAQEGRLRAHGGPGDLEPFSPAGEDAFLSGEYVLLLYERDAAGRIAGFTVATPRTRNLKFTRDAS